MKIKANVPNTLVEILAERFDRVYEGDRGVKVEDDAPFLTKVFKKLYRKCMRKEFGL